MRYLAILLFLLFPALSYAAPMFSEIAWMGTDEDANNEWIEIYNFGNAPQDLTGWTVTDGGSLSITLTGTLGPHGVGLLERTDDTSVPSVTALMAYTGAMPNTGESGTLTLTLRDPSGTIVDQVVGGKDWTSIGGSNVVPKKTAQRTRMNTWVTSAPTPGDQNAQVSEEVPKETTETPDTSDEPEARDSGAGVRVSLVEPQNELLLDFMLPSVVYVHEPITFTSRASGIGPNIINSLVYHWNFGDTETASGKEATHMYTYPGEYVVVLNASYARHDETVRKTIKVIPVALTLTRTAGGDIHITNTADHDIDLSGYIMRGTRSFTLPRDTYVLRNGGLTVPKEKVLEGNTGLVFLYDTENEVVARENVSLATTLQGKETVRSAVTMSASPKRVVQSSGNTTVEPDALSKSDTERSGEVAGTSTVFEGLTIPVYAAESENEPVDGRSRNILPYAGLVALIVVGVVLLYRRPEAP